MAAFPALEPDSREWWFPEYPALEFQSKTWGGIWFEYGSTPGPIPLALIYEWIEESSFQPVRDHYLSHGMVNPFVLNSTIWAGYTPDQIQTIAPLTTQWRYAEPLDESRPAPGYVRSRVALISVVTDS